VKKLPTEEKKVSRRGTEIAFEPPKHPYEQHSFFRSHSAGADHVVRTRTQGPAKNPENAPTR
jgi:hypothetical protein